VFKQKINAFLKVLLRPALLQALADIKGGGFAFKEGSIQSDEQRQLLINFLIKRLWEGKAVDGTQIGKYSESVVKRKRRKGLPYDRVTLFETGRFYNSFVLKATREGLRVSYQEDPYKYVVRRYGGEGRLLRVGFRSVGEKELVLNKLRRWLKKK